MNHPEGNRFRFSLRNLFGYITLFSLLVAPPVVLIRMNPALPPGEIIGVFLAQWISLWLPAIGGGVIGRYFKREFEGALIGLAIWMFGASIFSSSMH